METTRHFTATVYIVHDGATALHEHGHLGIRVPPGGHVDRDELPHETAIRECREETGLVPTILAVQESIEAEGGRSLPRPRRQMLYDVNVFEDRVGHQHVDHVYYATVPSGEIDPEDGEVRATAWEWYSRRDLRESDLAEDVVTLGCEAIEAASRA